MRKIFWIAFVAGFFMAGLSQAGEQQAPKIAVTGERHDLGKIVQGTEAVHTFEIRNAGNQPLLIERLQPS